MTSMTDKLVAVRLSVSGQVQGVGFRPFVHRLAVQCRLGGRVANTAGGVVIEVEGRVEDVDRFQRRLASDAPASAGVTNVAAVDVAAVGRTAFTIEASETEGNVGIRVPPDLAVCADCRRELLDPANRRFGYPFTNCTACGPRYSIIERMPYDRARTTMTRFAQCRNCETEYTSPIDRRFHAEANACGACGPTVALWDENGRSAARASDAITTAVDLLRRGGIVAVKGLGGFQLLVRADNASAVHRLRALKHRPTKPLAVMVADLPTAERLADLGPKERTVLASPENPIVLVRRIADRLPDAVAPGLIDFGLFLPTTPLHALLLSELEAPVVATSGNRGEEPIVTDEHKAVDRLAGLADAFLVHDRPIRRGVDDSVVAVMDGRASSYRLARGFAPFPLPTLERFDGPPILALGGHQKSALALWNGRQAVLGQHIGDLDTQPTRSAMGKGVRDLESLYRCDPAVVACDLHPDYFTSRWTEQSGRRVIQVQHHHAHVVGAQVEHGLLDREVLGIAWDGTGFGTDGTLWGGEIMRVDGVRFSRTASLLPMPLAGGEAAIRRPSRIAFAMLRSMGATKQATPYWLECLGITTQKAVVLSAMLEKGINVAWSSGVGRLFDAVAALVVPMLEASFEGEAAMRLEALVDPAIEDRYELPLGMFSDLSAGDASVPRIDWRPMIAAILTDLQGDVPPRVIAARFHNSLIDSAVRSVKSHPDLPIVLAGGCFQNRLLTERIADALRAAGRECFTPGLIPTGDGGLAAGQLAVAMARLNADVWRRGAT